MAALYFVLFLNDKKSYSGFTPRLEFPWTSIELMNKIKDTTFKV